MHYSNTSNLKLCLQHLRGVHNIFNTKGNTSMKEENIFNSLYGFSSDYAFEKSNIATNLLPIIGKYRNHVTKRCHLYSIFICGVGFDKIQTLAHCYQKSSS